MFIKILSVMFVFWQIMVMEDLLYNFICTGYTHNLDINASQDFIPTPAGLLFKIINFQFM